MIKKLDLNLVLRLWVILIIHSGCTISGQSGVGSFTKMCNIPSDQTGTLEGRWLTKPIPVAFHNGDFSSNDTTSMTNAMATWNNFFNASKGAPIYSYGSAGSPQMTTASNPASFLCSQSNITTNNQFTNNIGVYKVSNWGYNRQYIAQTSFCIQTVAGQTYPSMYSAVMEVNYQDFFVNGMQPDLQSVILHEMGHLLGLSHSCGPNANMPNCSSSNLNPDYINAVMYPSFNFSAQGIGQQKRLLQINDQSRANCLY
jgi:hypothetical protein